MFKWLKEKGQEGLKNEFKYTIDKAREVLTNSLKYYYESYFKENVSDTQNYRTGTERFYLFMCAAYGFVHTELNRLVVDDELSEYFVQYLPLRVTNQIDENIAKKVFEGYDIQLTNHEGVIGAFGYAAGMITEQTCQLSTSAARTGGHMHNIAVTKKRGTIPADDIYLEFKKKGSLFRDGDQVRQGLQLIFDNKDHKLHELKII